MKCWRQLLGSKLWVVSKLKLNPINGKVWGHLDRRSQGKCEATSSQFWFVSLIRRELFTKNLFLLVKQLILHSTSKFWNVYGRMCEGRDLISDGTTRLLHHDNVPTHAALLTRPFLTDNDTTVVPHPPHSPDLAPSDFLLFPKLKMKLKGRRFQTLEEIQAQSQAVLNTLRENDFHERFKNWQCCWVRC